MSLNLIERTYRELSASGHPILKLFSGNPNEQGFCFPPEILEEAYQRYFRNQTYQPDPKGLLKAREAVAGYYARQGAVVDPENILLTSGTSESFFSLFSLLARPGDNLLTPHPAYPLFEHIARLAHVELRPYHLQEDQNWRIDLEDLKRRTDSRTRAILLISPNNPTGVVVEKDQIQEIVSWANQKGIPLICDEVFSEFYYGAGIFPRPIAVAAPNLCFTLNGISKMFALPALKCGWIVVTGEKVRVAPAIDALEMTTDTFLSCHTPIQEALPELFSHGESFVREYREEVGRRRRLTIRLLKKMPDIRFVEPAGGFYLMARWEGAVKMVSEEDFVITLMRETGVFVHPGYFYDYEKGVHFVLSYLIEPASLEQGLRSIDSFLRSHSTPWNSFPYSE